MLRRERTSKICDVHNKMSVADCYANIPALQYNKLCDGIQELCDAIQELCEYASIAIQELCGLCELCSLLNATNKL